MSKFNCKKCKTEYEILSYSIILKNEIIKYVDSKTKTVFNCKKCKTELLKVEEKIEGFCTNFGKFNSSSIEDKKNILKKRSSDHFKKEIKEVKYNMDKNE